MSSRGSYAKGIAKREEILATALQVFGERGQLGTSLREVADAVGLSQAGLLHYFDSKDELYSEILRKRDEAARERFGDDDDVNVVIEVVRHNSAVPGLARLFASMSTAAAESGHVAHDYFRLRYEELRAGVALSVRQHQARGELAPDLDADMLATLFLAAADGLQIQWLYDPSRDMGEHLSYLWHAVLSAHRAAELR